MPNFPPTSLAHIVPSEGLVQVTGARVQTSPDGGAFFLDLTVSSLEGRPLPDNGVRLVLSVPALVGLSKELSEKAEAFLSGFDETV